MRAENALWPEQAQEALFAHHFETLHPSGTTNGEHIDARCQPI
jgi:hypothetical protein